MWLVSILHPYCARLGHCYLQNLHSVKQKASLYFLTLKDLLENTADCCSPRAVVIKVWHSPGLVFEQAGVWWEALLETVLEGYLRAVSTTLKKSTCCDPTIHTAQTKAESRKIPWQEECYLTRHHSESPKTRLRVIVCSKQETDNYMWGLAFSVEGGGVK